MVSALSNYFMASLGTDEVLREVWAGNLPTQLHETIGLIFLTDAFTRASGMMLIGMGLYKTGYLKNPVVHWRSESTQWVPSSWGSSLRHSV